MRLSLDAHVSGRKIADALRERGHDVRAADEERELDGWEDERLLELATTGGRILVSFNVKDFARIVNLDAPETRFDTYPEGYEP